MKTALLIALFREAWGWNRENEIRDLFVQKSAEEIENLIRGARANPFYGIGEDGWSALRSKYARFNAEREEERLYALGIEPITFLSDKYPRRLQNIFDPPLLLYQCGQIPEYELGAAVVGARKASAYGRAAAFEIATDLARAGFTIISGMARGIDTEGHRGALLGDGKTVAVLGSGLDVIYPRENKALFKEIVNEERGAVISEYPLGTEPLPFHFPRRNRIISGLADGIVVVEAGLKSGSLITAELALDQGRDVFSLPGPTTNPGFRGSHKLIREGAQLVESAADILEHYLGELRLFNHSALKKDRARLGPEEEKIFSRLSEEPLGLEEIIAAGDEKAEDMLSLLLLMELKGLVKQHPGRKFTRTY